MRRFLGTSLLAAVVVTLGFVGTVAATPHASASDRLDSVLNLPLVNRDASNGPGGVNPALPTDPMVLRSLLDEARSRSIAPSSYRALLSSTGSPTPRRPRASISRRGTRERV